MTIKSAAIDSIISVARSIYGEGFIPLHRPVFEGNEKAYLVDCIDSNFVSSVGIKVEEFENHIAAFAGTKYAIATVNGTAALHIALQLSGVKRDEEVITQALTFVATCNAISYLGAQPNFIDVDMDTMGMSPTALRRFLDQHADKRPDGTFNKTSGKRLAACVPMHTFGLPCRIAEIVEICTEYDIPVIEDTAESLGSYVGKRHTGTFGAMSTFSFNGNKLITTGGGGMIVTDDKDLAVRAKYLTTTAKSPHPYEFSHDEIGYNYRMPNLNAALGCAQIERIQEFLEIKSGVADQYRQVCHTLGLNYVDPTEGNTANFWLSAIVLDSLEDRNEFLKVTNEKGVMTRPIWRLMSGLPMFIDCQNDGLENSHYLEDRVVNLPSSVPFTTSNGD